MPESYNVATVADSKPEAPAEKPPEAAAPAIPSVLSSDHSLGEIMTMAREAGGCSREQAAKASNIPGYYLTMIESDDYSSIADQLYLLPFLRRYATFVGLEPEEVASRFIREVQRADMNPGRAPEPIAMIAERKTFPWGIIVMMAVAIVGLAAAWFGYRYYEARKSVTETSKAPVAAAQAAPEAEQVVPKAADTAPANVAAPLSLPSAAVPPAAAPAAAVAPPAAAAPLGASTANSAGHPAARASSSAPSRSPAARPRVPVKPH